MKMVNLMGHSSKKMVFQNYGEYMEDLDDDLEDILNYYGMDFLVKPEKTRPSY
jgi:integrase